MKLSYHSSNFPRIFHPECRSGWQILEFNEYDLLHAAYTVGRANRWDVIQYGPHSYYEMIYRSAMLLANLEEGSDGFLYKSDAYKALDPSEKSAVSYFIGITLTKLLADKLLGIAYLMHLEIYASEIEQRYGPITYRRGKSRPDLIGISTELNPHVFEAKGRSSGFDSDAFNKAKNQARMIVDVGGVRPVINVGGEAYFNNENRLEYKWKDPEPMEESYNLDFLDLEQMVADYYRPYLYLINRFTFGERIIENGRIIDLPLLDVSIEIPKSLIDYFLYKDSMDVPTSSNLKTILEQLPRPIESQIGTEKMMVRGNDGLLFEFGENWKGRFKKKNSN